MTEADPTTAAELYRIPQQIQRAEVRLRKREGGTPPKAATAILTFYKDRSRAVGDFQKLKYLERLPVVARALGPEFLKPTVSTARRFLTAFSGQEQSSVLTLKNVTEAFWRWMYARKGKEFPLALRIPVDRKLVKKKNHGDVLTPEDALALANHTRNQRDRAFVLVAWESGARVSEMLLMRRADVEITGEGYVRLHLHREKGSDDVPVLLFEDSVPALMKWLEVLPSGDEGGAFLWVHVSGQSHRGRPITERYALAMLKSSAKSADIQKKVHPHIFRHSRATHEAYNPKIPRSAYEAKFGWKPGSIVASRYIHGSGRDMENAYRAAAGLPHRDQAPLAPPRVSRTCGRCKTVNPSGAKYCSTCAGPLTIEAAGEIEQQTTAANRLRQLLEDPSVMRYLARKLGGAGAKG
ncbi:MAG TPA: tyrosine-type recombinase/integrase [Thermoplasmata archaeon]|nr:tyrosine-type recombinase/integrase [Thermoplasmata archaeon]